jgi:hypothetical protein
MTVSFNCLARSLAPFVPGPLDLVPTEKIEDWLNRKRMLAKAAASNYNLRDAEFELFEDWWALSEPARDLRDLDHLTDGWGPMAVEVRAAVVRVAAIANNSAAYGLRGYQHVRRVPNEGRFVVFSDHHMGFAGSRHDFFRESGNSGLYAEALTAYADAGFTLVENGDVEELIIHEPLAPPPQATLATRSAWRRSQLAQVINNHRDLYDQINAQFVEQGRYIRIAGNHDQDLQDSSFLEVLRTVYPALDQVYDFLVIEPAESSPGVVIGHGHHFDTASTPAFAAQIGELLSECLGWAYEGADRVWRWGNGDGVEGWATGDEAYTNTLVTDDSDPYQLSSDTVAALTTALMAVFAPPVPWNPIPAAALELVTALMVELRNSAFWEDTFHGNIAWEYFRSEDPAEAVFNEVFCGQRWFKFRHLDEVFIDDRLNGDEQSESPFGSDPPYLLLGHSHEPRHRSWNPATSTQSDRYLNSGSAGRFENLIWCTEIIDGVPQVAAWHRPGGPQSDDAPERRTYTPGVAGATGTLTASDAHVPVPALDEAEEQRRTWLAPVLRVMMAQA